MKFFLILSSLLAMAACNPKLATNSTSRQQQTEEWKVLFDGTTMNGWRIYKNLPNDSWEVVDGTFHCKPRRQDETNKRSDLITVDQYQNFELTLEWRLSPRGNSGIMYRATEEYSQPYYSGPEYQVIDNEGYPDKLTEGQRTAANYDMHAAPLAVPKPIGEWNQSKIVVNGNHVEHWLNGLKVVEYELHTDDWIQRKAASKWKDEKGYGMAAKGHIVLQDHDCEVWYRNIKIKVL